AVGKGPAVAVVGGHLLRRASSHTLGRWLCRADSWFLSGRPDPGTRGGFDVRDRGGHPRRRDSRVDGDGPPRDKKGSATSRLTASCKAVRVSVLGAPRRRPTMPS